MKQPTMQCLLVLSLVLSVSAPAATAQTGTYTVVRAFAPWGTDGCCQGNPGMLAEALDGNVYGTNPSQLGGYGTLIDYSPASGGFTRFNFRGGADGNSPLSGVTLGVDGNLYGTTEWGGNTGTVSSGYGTVFQFTPGASTNPRHIYEFVNSTVNGFTDGGYPWAPPVQAQDGSLWGVSSGGSSLSGWYKMSTAGAILNQGTLPALTQAPLTVAFDGNLYGTTPYGNGPNLSYNRGTVFKLTPAGVLTVLYSFNPNDPYEGLIPQAPVLVGYDGFLYGTTCDGGKTASGMAGGATTGQGTVFRIARDGSSFSTIHTFQDNATTLEGYCPTSGLVQGSDLKLYGVTSAGGGASNTNINGVLFRLNTDGSGFEILHPFDKATGWYPVSNLLMDTNGLIYGMTRGGGSGYGVLFSYNAKLQPFAKLVIPWSGPVGTVINILGQGFNSATGVLIGGVAVPWGKFSQTTIVSDTWMRVTVPAGAKSGFVTVLEPSGNLVTRESFKITCTPGTLGCLTRL